MQNPIRPGETIVLGLSGGADSVYLLYQLLEWKKERPFHLIAAHIHHGLRESADRDLHFVETLCKKEAVPLFFKRVSIPTLARSWGMGEEEAGRKVRYDFFRELQRGKGRIATAHHEDDLVETLLMRILRGTGPAGFRGILNEGEFLRPLLGLSRSEIEDSLRARGIPYCEDETNRDLRILRNRLRHEILPSLEEINPRVKEALLSLREILLEEEEILEGWVKDWLSDHEKEGRFSRMAFLACPEALQRRILRRLWAREGKKVPGRGEIRELLKATRGATGSLREFEGLRLSRDYDELVIERLHGEENEPSDYQEKGDVLLTPGEHEVDGLRIRLSEEPYKGVEKNCYAFDPKAIRGPLILRQRRPKDRFTPDGMTGEKKVKDYFIDQKVERKERERRRLLCDEDGILAILGHRRASRAKCRLHQNAILIRWR